MKKYIIIPFVILLLFILSCAQPGALTGGDKDTIPPQIKRSSPQENGINFNDEKIIIKFDEYFEYNKIESQFFSSPPQKEQPKFKIKGKKAIILFKEKLKDSVTYTLEFGNSIKDFNEGIKIKNMKFVFSTYDILDTLSISGNLTSAFSNEPQKDVFVMVYKKNKDSLPYQILPDYISRTDSMGYFIINNIKADNYKIFALKDINNNMMYDNVDEEIAFLDSLYLPYAESFLHIDTLKAGTILHKDKNKKDVDTLLTDSILYFNEVSNYPKDIKIFLFAEDNKPQFVVRNTRSFKGEARFIFNKPLINDSIFIKPINFENNNNCFLEKFPTTDSIIFWTKDSSIYNMDTLIFEVNYLQKDSTDNLSLKTDTLNFAFWNDLTDSLPLEISHNIEKTFDLFKDINIKTPSAISLIDTSKIHLYELVDSLVTGEKVQDIKILRTTNDSIILYFNRPVDSLKITQNNSPSIKNCFSFFPNKTNDTIICKINDQEVLHTDTLNISLLYDNLYFFDVMQMFSKNILLPINNQKRIYAERATEDSIIIAFEKPLTKKVNLIPINFISNKNWYSYKNKYDTLFIKITDKNVFLKDTIKFSINYLDYIDKNGEHFFNDTIELTYKWKKQKISESIRYEKGKFRFAFSKKMEQKPSVKIINYQTNKNWFTTDINTTKDTFIYNIIDKEIKNLDTLKLSITYNNFNKYDSLHIITDSLNLLVKKLPIIPIDTADNRTKITVNKPMKFTFKKDSIWERSYFISSDFKQDTSYKLVIDSLLFTDIFGNKNDTLSTVFTIQKADYYGSLKINIQNTGALLFDTLKTPKILRTLDTIVTDTIKITEKLDIDSLNNEIIIDSLKINNIERDSIYLDSIYSETLIMDSLLTKGQAIVQFIIKANDEEKILEEYIINNDTIIEIKNIPPETYYIKIIYDENKNGKWDTGNYLKHKQPERVYYSKSLGIKSDWLTEEKWIIGIKE